MCLDRANVATSIRTDRNAMLLRAVEEKRFLPVGSDKEVKSDFQLIAGTNCDLQSAVHDGKFRDDLLARMNLWTFRLPALRDRREDIEPNLEYELEQFAKSSRAKVTFNKESRERFHAFATSGEAMWTGNFRDLNAAVTRMATMSSGGRVNIQTVEAEISRLRASWSAPAGSLTADVLASGLDKFAVDEIDPFDRAQLAEVINVCRRSRTLSGAGRARFAVSRKQKESSNDADRLRKYLAPFGLTLAQLQADRSGN